MKIPVMIQMQNGENAATALCMILGYHKRFVPISEMRNVCISSRNGSSPQQISDAAAVYGLDTSIDSMTIDQLRQQSFPVMIQWKKRYYCLIESIRKDIVTVVDPAKGSYKITLEKLTDLFTGTVISFREGESFHTGGKQETLFTLIKGRITQLRRPMIILSVFTIACIVLNVLMMNLEKHILDKYMSPKDDLMFKDATPLIALYAVLMCTYTVLSILKTRHINSSSRGISAASGIQLFKKILSQPMRFFEQLSAYEMISRIESNVTLDGSILKSVVPRVIDAVMSVVYIIYLFSYNAVIASACIAVVFISLLASSWVQSRNAIASKSMATNGSNVNASLLNGLNMIDTIQSTGSERSFYNMWYRSQYNFNSSRILQSRYTALSNLITMLSRSLLQALMLFMGAYFVVHGNFTLGGMSMFQGILSSMITSVNNCIGSVNVLQSMRTNIERVNDINNRESIEKIPLKDEDYESADKLEGSLTARNICYRYNPGDPLALDNVSIEVKPGQMIAIVGSTGCGKSTLLKVLADLYEAESGEVLYAGKKRQEIPDVIFHSSVSTVDQEAVMFEDSIYNNIKMWDSTIQNYEVILAARDAQIHGRITKERKNYSAIMKENGRNFSGGELQRIELARALAPEPTLLFLDEFTSALDAMTEDKAIEALRQKGTTCVIVAHRLSTIVDCDRIYVMDKGKVIQQGTHAELYAQEGLYRTLVG